MDKSKKLIQKILKLQESSLKSLKLKKMLNNHFQNEHRLIDSFNFNSFEAQRKNRIQLKSKIDKSKILTFTEKRNLQNEFITLKTKIDSIYFNNIDESILANFTSNKFDKMRTILDQRNRSLPKIKNKFNILNKSDSKSPKNQSMNFCVKKSYKHSYTLNTKNRFKNVNKRKAYYYHHNHCPTKHKNKKINLHHFVCDIYGSRNYLHSPSSKNRLKK